MSPFSFFAFSPLSCWISHLKKLLIEQSGVSVRFTIDGIGITWLASNPVPPLLSMIVRKPRATLRHFRSRRDIFMLTSLEWGWLFSLDPRNGINYSHVTSLALHSIIRVIAFQCENTSRVWLRETRPCKQVYRYKQLDKQVRTQHWTIE